MFFDGKKGVKSLVVQVLSNEWPLESKKIYRRIIRVTPANVSYQGVHKQIRELVESGVLKKIGHQYALNTSWLKELNQFSEQAIEKYLEVEGIPGKDEFFEDKLIVLGRRHLSTYANVLREKFKEETTKKPVLTAREVGLNSFGERENRQKTDVLPTVTSSKHVLILGASGSGKTTTLKRLGIELFEDGRIPVFFKLTNFSGQNLQNIIANEITRTSGQQVSEHFILELLKEGSFALLLDGLNEANGTLKHEGKEWSKQGLAIQKINERITAYPKNVFVVSTRLHDDPRDKLPLCSLRLLPLSEKDVQNYLKSNNRQHLYAKLKQNKKLLSLCGNPLFLNLLIKHYDTTQTLSENRQQAYAGILEDFLGNWETKTTGGNAQDVSNLLQALETLALEMTEKGTSIETHKAEQVIGKTVSDLGLEQAYTSKLIEDAVKTGLLISSGSQLQFMHQSLQEYLSAKGLLRAINTGNISEAVIAKEYSSQEWRESVIQLSGMLEDSTKLIKSLKTKDAVLAGECLENAGHVSQEIVEEIIESLVSLQEVKSVETRWTSLSVLERLGRNAVDLILERLKTEKEDAVKRRLYWVLGHFKESRVEPFLYSRLNEKEVHTLCHVLEGLYELNGLKNIEPLKQALRHEHALIKAKAIAIIEQNKRIASMALRQEAERVREGVIQDALKCLESSEYWLRSHTALALGHLKAEEAVEKLVEQVGFDSHGSARWYASVALGLIGSKKSLKLLEEMQSKTKFKQDVAKAMELVEAKGCHSRELVDVKKQ